MSMVRRSLRNLFRSRLRTALMVVLVAVSVGLALIMLTVHNATQNQLGSIGGQIGTDIEVRPAGSYGLEGGGSPLNDSDVNKLSSIPHAVAVEPSVTERYTGSALQPSVPSGTLGGRGNFRMGIIIMGLDPAVNIADVRLMGGNAQPTIAQGRYFTSNDADADVAILGQGLAQTNSLTVGSIVDIPGTSDTTDTPVQVIGIYSSGTVFANGMLVMPVKTVESLYGLSGVTSVTVVADNANNVNGIVTAIRQIFPENVADITTAQDQYQRINGSVVNAGKTSQIAMIAGFAIAGVVILFSVILMVRQRIKEIGILKAIGASNRQVGLQVSLETLAVSLVGAVIGALITYPLAQKVGNMLVGSSSGPSGGFAGGGGFFTRLGGTVAGIHVAVSPQVFLYALGIAVALAVVASVFPAWYIARVKPAEVLRNE